ncbi:MAG TPA: hypothetical protein VGK58_07890 [Lacipirellulaceae bacterium]
MTCLIPIRQPLARVSHGARRVVLLLGFATCATQAIDLAAEEPDPFEENRATAQDPFEAPPGPTASNSTQLIAPRAGEPTSPMPPLDEAIYFPPRPAIAPLQINFQIPPPQPAQSGAPLPPQAGPSATADDPCAAAVEKPMSALGIYIGLPTGELPVDHAAACWESVNQSRGASAAERCWAGLVYHWDATSLCHRPLYFEEINLERHGYGCCACLQPVASAAHFFGTVPALPYCMAAECPCECVYTLGHYRPGSCPPWRCHWPPCDPLAIAAEGGVLTGMIFLIP